MTHKGNGGNQTSEEPSSGLVCPSCGSTLALHARDGAAHLEIGSKALPSGMMFIDPHAHMISRTTDDYQAMAGAGVVAVI
jgi:uncharacterized protein